MKCILNISHHTNQDDINDILTLNNKTLVGAKKRLNRLVQMRNVGDFHHIIKISRVGSKLAVYCFIQAISLLFWICYKSGDLAAIEAL